MDAFRMPSWRFWAVQAAVWSAFGVVDFAVSSLSPELAGLPTGPLAVPTAVIEACCLFASSTLIYLWLERRVRPGAALSSFTLEAIAAVAVGVVVASALCTAGSMPFYLGQRQALAAAGRWGPGTMVLLVFSLVFTFGVMLGGWTAAYGAFRFLRESARQRAHTLEARALASDAQLTALRYQLNPHFLFNTLASLRELVWEDAARAEQVVVELAEFLRMTLTPAQTREVGLEEELALARTYLSIEKARFEEALEIRFEVDPAAATARIPPLLLNPLVENAVKYGHRTSPTPLQVVVSAQSEEGRLVVRVSNTGTLVGGGPSGFGVGLTNVRERLALLYPGLHQVSLREEAGWVHATLTLPLGTPSAAAGRGGAR